MEHPNCPDGIGAQYILNDRQKLHKIDPHQQVMSYFGGYATAAPFHDRVIVHNALSGASSLYTFVFLCS